MKNNAIPPRPPRRFWRNAASWLCGTVAVVVVLAVAAILSLWAWFTPAHVQNLINRDASKYLLADVRIDGLRWDISHLPMVTIGVDSLAIQSHALDGLTAGQSHNLPADPNRLLTAGATSVTIDIRKAMKGEIVISRITSSHPDVNLVALDNGKANWDIVLPGTKKPGTKSVNIGKVSIGAPLRISMYDAQMDVNGSLAVNRARIVPPSSLTGNWQVMLAAVLDGSANGWDLPRPLPVKIDGSLDVAMHPFAFSTQGMEIGIANLTADVSTAAHGLKETVIDNLNLSVTTPDVESTLSYLPSRLVAMADTAKYIPKGLSLDFPLTLTARLDSPWHPGSKNIPVGNASVETAGLRGNVSLPQSSRVSLDNASVKARIANGADSVLHLTAAVNVPRLSMKSNVQTLQADSLTLALKVQGTLKGTGTKGVVDLGVARFAWRGPSASADLADVSLDVKGKMREVPFTPASWSVNPASAMDALVAREVRHTPLAVGATAPGAMGTVLMMADADVALSVGQGSFHADGYPVQSRFKGLKLSTDLDGMDLSVKNLTADNTTGRLRAHAAGLRSFMSGNGPTPLRSEAFLDLDNVDINRLCARYYEAVTPRGENPDFKVAQLQGYTAADSLCVVIPRNLDIALHLSARQAEYMQMHFSPLSTTLSVHDGVARIGDLTIGAPYTTAKVDWIYSTADLGDIFMNLDVDVDDFDVDDFMKAFPALDKGMASGIDGHIGLHAGGRFNMYPSMFVMAPSMVADATLHADSVSLARDSRKIMRISHLMMIHGDEPVELAGIDAHASFHDNLLQVDPFTVQAGPYRLMLGGVNNLNGQMYYHAGLMHSPFHIPFGVNFVGDWRHPAIRFGGKEIHDGRGREIAADLTDHVNVNIMRQLKHGWLQFVATAAKYGWNHNEMAMEDVE